LVSNQVRYSLLDRKIESNGILQTAKELGISVIAYSPLAQGLVTGKFHENPGLLKNIGMRKHSSQFKPGRLERSRPLIETIRKFANKYEVSTSQIALNWLIYSHGDTVVAIPGATKESHARENTGTLNFRLSAEDLALLDLESAMFRY
jgi:aryl-alcohol dehydrogenase-like predicted oxidoreductase